MTRGLQAGGRGPFVLLVVCALLVTQAYALVIQHEAHHAGARSCLLCHIGLLLPFLETSVVVVAPLFALASMVLDPRSRLTPGGLSPAVSSRAPPV